MPIKIALVKSAPRYVKGGFGRSLDLRLKRNNVVKRSNLCTPKARAVSAFLHSLDRLAAKCEAAGMRISCAKSEAMTLSRNPVVCLLRVGNECLAQVKEFKYLGVFFVSEGMTEREIGQKIGAASGSPHQSLSMGPGKGKSEAPCWSCCPRDPTPDKRFEDE